MSTVHYIDRKPRPDFERVSAVNFIYDPHPLSPMPPDCPMRDEEQEFGERDMARMRLLAWGFVIFALGCAIGGGVMAVAARVMA